MSVEELAAHWRRLVEDRDAQVARLHPGAGGPGFWDQRAEGFARAVRAFQPDRLLEMLLARVAPGTTVLDVGSGPGRYAIPLAGAGAHVTAVEPSEGMAGFLQQAVAEAGIANLSVVPAAWQDADAPTCDLVLCSHVVYGVQDIVPFLQKLDSRTGQACFIAIRITQFDSYVRPLWELVYGEPRAPEPTFMELYGLLYELGITANVEVVPFGGRRGTGPGGGFADVDEAIDRCREMLFLDPEPAMDARIREYLAPRLQERDGRLIWQGPAMTSAIVWWTQDSLHRHF